MLLLAVFSQHQAKLITAFNLYLNYNYVQFSKSMPSLPASLNLAYNIHNQFNLFCYFANNHKSVRYFQPFKTILFFDALFTKIEHFQQLNVIKNYNPQFLAEGVFSMVVNYLLFQTTGELTDQPLSQQDVVTLIHGFLLTGNE